MYRKTYVALACLGLLLGTAGCDTFLTGDKLSTNPNLPTAASIQQLFVGVQAGQFAFEEGTVAMMMCEWVQACSATNGRFVQNAAQYNFGEGSNIAANGGDWISVYDGGGLVDIKQVEADAAATGDSSWLGIAKIWEAFTMGTASAMWGDIPYSQAISSNTSPALDNRFVILGNLQTLLTDAIAELTNGSGAGPGVADLVFGVDTAFRHKWIKVAWTLKARYYIETAESLGAAAYNNAITAATNGISDPSGASDFRSFHSTATSERNMWAQFQTSSGFGGDLEAGKALADYMNARSDPRRAQYFCPNKGGGYGGDDFNTAVPADSISNFLCLPPRFQGDARIPYVTYVENELILAEAYNQTGNDALALTHLNNARATVAAPISTPLVGITGAALLDSIMLEKWVSSFQNMESISDYRRTCIPALTPSANAFNFTHVPGRLYYPQNERNVNTNVPDASTQLATHGFRNAGDVHACQGSDNLP
jgi:starch-binding outer membrane protein, SusD/RagB family